jgi:hypothetical protein
MAEDSGRPDHGEAQRMLDLCASVGACRFDVTWTTSAGEPRRYDEGVGLADLTRSLPGELNKATARQRNLIIRPRRPDSGPGVVTSIQLDDLIKRQQLPAVAFVTLQTSPGNHQAWLALPGSHGREFCSRVRKGAGADTGASGATRIPGSFNFKPDHAPEKTGRPYPRVAIIEAHPQLTTTPAQLERLKLVAPEPEIAPLAPARFESQHLRQWPDYQYNLDRARPNKTGDGLDLSGVDFVWCMTAATWGFEVSDTAEKLLEVSEHARHPSNGKDYALRTARTATGYVERRRQQAIKHARGCEREFRSTYSRNT